MDRRTFVKGSAAVVGASTLPAGRVYAQASSPDKIRFGYAITQSGPLGPGAESTTVSQYKLWQKRVNDAGGITLKKFNKKVPVEFVSYDDQGKPDELLKLTERLIQQDKVDMMLGPYATHMNLAAAPIINKYEYPVIMTTATTSTSMPGSRAPPGTRTAITTTPWRMPIHTGRICITVTTMIRPASRALDSAFDASVSPGSRACT